MRNIKAFFSLTFFLLFFSFQGDAQNNINGIVLDSVTHAPLGFINIGILENTNGTVSDENGNYELKLRSGDKTIKFSGIGFFSKTFSTKDWELLDTVFLAPRTYGLNTIEVSGKEFDESKTLGTKVKSKNSVVNWEKSTFLGVEVGVPIKIKKESLIKSAHFSIHKSSNKSILLRLNIYEYKKGKVGKNLLIENIFVQTQDLIDYGKIDLSHLNLIVDHDVLVSLETIEKRDLEEFSLAFRMKVRRKTNIFYRDASQAKFKKGLKGGAVPFVQIGCYLKVKQ